MSSSSAVTVVIGAGPYGLSVASHLRERGLAVRVFGDVMSSWRDHMPVGMCLKSTPDASSLSAPRPGYTLADFCAAHGTPRLQGDDVVPLELFLRYGEWFQRRLVPGVEPEKITRIGATPGGFRLRLASGEEFGARSVIVASGLTGFAYVPPELTPVSPDGPSAAGLVSHSSQHRDLTRFAGQDVAVIGAGQSALESAALLHESGARVQVLARRAARFAVPPRPAAGLAAMMPQPRSPLGPGWRIYPFSHAAGMFRYLPAETRLRLVKQVLGPLGAWWLADRVVGQLPVLDGHRVVGAARDGGSVVLSVQRSDGQQRELKVDHVLAATGYRVDVDKLGFLDRALRDRLRRTGGWPHLSRSFESTVPGLYFVGLPAAAAFGPVMRFVCGTPWAARRVSQAASQRAQ